MSMNPGGSMNPYDVIGAMQPSYSPQGYLIYGEQDYMPITQGSELGVPPPTQIAGQTSGGGDSPSTNNVAFGRIKAINPPHAQPIFWSLVLMAIGLIVIGHAAWVSSKV